MTRAPLSTTVLAQGKILAAIFFKYRPPSGGHQSGVCLSRKKHIDCGEF